MKLVPFKSLDVVSYSPSIVTIAVYLAVCEISSVSVLTRDKNHLRYYGDLTTFKMRISAILNFRVVGSLKSTSLYLIIFLYILCSLYFVYFVNFIITAALCVLINGMEYWTYCYATEIITF